MVFKNGAERQFGQVIAVIKGCQLKVLIELDRKDSSADAALSASTVGP